MRKRHAGLAAEVDDVGRGLDHPAGAGDQLLDAERRRIDDLGEDPDIVLAEIGVHAFLAEERRQIVDLVRPPEKRHAEMGRQAGEVHPASPGEEDRRRADGRGEAAPDDRLGQQGGDLDPHVAHLEGESRVGEARQHPFETRFRKPAGKEDVVALVHPG